MTVYTVGTQFLKLSTLREIVAALDIHKILDWRKDIAPRALQKSALEGAFSSQYQYVGTKCNAELIPPGALDRLAAQKQNVLLLFHLEIPGDCPRHEKIAMPLARRGVSVAHIFEDEVIEAAELERSMVDDNDYASTEWRQAAPALPEDPAEKPAPIPVAIQKRAESLMENAVMLSVNTGSFGNHRKIPTSKIEIDADKALIRASKLLLDSAELSELTSFDGETSRWLRDICLPSNFKKGIYLVPMALLAKVDQYLKERATKRRPLVAAFRAAYPSRIEQASVALRSNFNRLDYPTADEVSARFVFTWQWIEIAVPGKKLRAITPELVAEEQMKFRRQCADAVALVQQTLRGATKELVDHLVGQLTETTPSGKRKKIFDSMLTRVNGFLEVFDARNIANDQELKEQVERIRKAVAGVATEDLKSNERTREYVGAAFTKIQTALDAMVTDRPKRVYKLEDQSDPAA